MVTPLGRAAIESAHWIGLLPLAVVGWARWKGKKVDRSDWWLSVAFVVSWVADSLAHWLDPWSVTFTYVIGQSVLVGAAFLSRKDAVRLLGALCFVGVVAMFARDAAGHDYLLHAVAWFAVACIAWEESLGRLRTALVIYFGLGAIAYLAYAGWPNWTSWGIYQSTRLLGIVLFCAVVWRPDTVPRVYRLPKRVLA